jgi:hypothetical protein
MPEMSQAPAENPDPAQAAEVSLLVDLEARWENLRKPSPPGPAGKPDLRELLARQKAYEAFHSKLVAYNRRYTPGHVPELLLNTPVRLAAWCRAMRDLYRQVEHAPGGHCPAHLLEKAYRWADRVAARQDKDRVGRSPPPDTIGDAVRDLEALAQWCDALAGVTPAEAVKV